MSKEKLNEISLEELIPQGKYKWNNLITKRKHSTKEALQIAKQYFEKFDLTAAADISTIESKEYTCIYKSSICYEYLHFENKKGKLAIVNRERVETKNFFDLEFSELDFLRIVYVFKDFLRRIDALLDNKDLEIIEFIDFCKS